MCIGCSQASGRSAPAPSRRRMKRAGEQLKAVSQAAEHANHPPPKARPPARPLAHDAIGSARSSKAGQARLETITVIQATARWLHSTCHADAELSQVQCYASQTDINTHFASRWLRASPVSALSIIVLGPTCSRRCGTAASALGYLRRPFASKRNRPAT